MAMVGMFVITSIGPLSVYNYVHWGKNESTELPTLDPCSELPILDLCSFCFGLYDKYGAFCLYLAGILPFEIV
jgi:hypothetical protein